MRTSLKNWTVAVVLVGVAAGVVFLLVGKPDPGPTFDEPMAEGPTAARPTPLAPAPTEKSFPAATRARTRPAPGPDDGVIRDHGSVRVALVAPPSGPAVAGARLDVESLGAGLVSYPLARAQDDGTWLYESLPVGKYRIRVVVVGYQLASERVTVERDTQAHVDVQLVPGGVVHWKATLLSGDAPESLRLVVFDGRGQPFEFVVQHGAGIARIAPNAAIDVASDGKVVGLAPDTYRLRATAPSGESDEQKVDVKAGETAQVAFSIRR